MDELFTKDKAEDELSSWMHADAPVRRLIHLLNDAFPSEQDIWLVGGSLRDRLLSKSFKDFDVVVDVASNEHLSNQLPQARKNFFGGLTFDFGGRTVDLWPLRETYHIREFGLESTIQSLLAGAPFNLDKIAFDIRNRVLFENGCLQALNDRSIAYAPLNPYLEHIQAARCIVLRKKTGFTLDDSARNLLSRVRAAWNEDDIVAMHAFLQKSYGLDDRARHEVLNEIDEFSNISTAPYKNPPIE